MIEVKVVNRNPALRPLLEQHYFSGCKDRAGVLSVSALAVLMSVLTRQPERLSVEYNANNWTLQDCALLGKLGWKGAE